MSKNTKIEWAHHTFNPWEGCQKVGPGCDNCYAENRNARFGGGEAINWGPGALRRRTSARNWQQPIAWNAEAERLGIRYRVFCASLADVFDNAVDPQWRVDLFELIRATPYLDWLLLTKRIGNAKSMIDVTIAEMDIGYDVPFTAWPYPNVWLGATIVNQEEADRDIPKLLAVPAAKRFLSMEPLLSPVKLRWEWVSCGRPLGGGPSVNIHEPWKEPMPEPAIDWVIVGGESGPNARPMYPEWARGLRDQCEAAGVPFFFKQWGEYAPNWYINASGQKIPGSEWIDRMGKKIAGRLLDGRTWDEVPA